jgi:hypothetical protein
MPGNEETNGDDEARQTKAESDKAVADARAAQTAADLAAAQYADYISPLARQQRDAAAQQAVAQAGQTTATAQQAQIASLIPDFSKVAPGTTTLQGDQPLFGSALARQALEKATETVVGKIADLFKDSAPKPALLLTTSPDLATSDAAYGEVVGGLQHLNAAVQAVLDDAAPPSGAKFLPVIAALASALPPLLSLLAPQRTISGFAVTPDTTTAMSFLAGRLTEVGLAVRIDDFRTVPQGEVQTLESGLRAERSKLIQKKVDRDGERIQADNKRISYQAQVDNLTKTLDGLAPSDPKYDGLQTKLETATAARDTFADETAKAADDVGVMTDLQTSIDAFLTGIHAVPSGGARSAYTLAALRQELHTSGSAAPTRVVYLSAAGGSAEQVLQHRPLSFKDKFECIASVSVSYWVLNPEDDTIIAAGNAGGNARLKGTIGGTIGVGTVDDEIR